MFLFKICSSSESWSGGSRSAGLMGSRNALWLVCLFRGHMSSWFALGVRGCTITSSQNRELEDDDDHKARLRNCHPIIKNAVFTTKVISDICIRLRHTDVNPHL